MSIRTALMLVATAALLVQGCDSAAVEDEVGSAGAIPPMEFELMRRVDGNALEFGQIYTLLADDEERIYVLDGMADQIVVVGRDGEPVTTIGQQGEGPGEFGSLVSFAWVGEHLLTMDVRLFRFTRFDPDGTVISMRRWEEPFVVGGSSSLLSGGNAAYARVQVFAGDPPADLDQYLIFSDGDSVSAFATMPEPETGPRGMMCASPDRRHYPGIPLPFHDRGPLRAFLPGGEIALGHRDAFRIEIFDVRSHERLREISLDAPPLELTDADWEMQPEVESYRALEQEHGGLLHRDASEPCPFDDHRPGSWPVLRTLVSDGAGRLWAESTARSKQGYTLTVFDTAGNPIGRAPMPRRDPSVTPYVRDSLLYLVAADDFGVQSIEVYRAEFRRH